LSIGAASFRTASPVSRYTLSVEITYDPRKSERNIRLRGISFEAASGFDLSSATFDQDTRNDYGEIRTLALGYIGETLHALVFTVRDGKIRVISLRRANRKERAKYAKAQS
jgi:uncharacterized DUF497 family protein